MIFTRVVAIVGILAASLTPAYAQDESQARGATPKDIVAWARQIQQDYPAAALRDAEQGTVAMQIAIDADGRVQSCEVTQTSKSEVLDEAACRGMVDYARYYPARDHSGKPIADSMTQSIRYVLPDGNGLARDFMPPLPIEMDRWRELAFDAEFETRMRESGNGTALYALTIDPEGNVSGCGVMQSSGSSELDNGVCRSLFKNAEFHPSWVHKESVNGFFAVPYPSYEALRTVRSQ